MIGNTNTGNRFRPSGRGGGSKKGKPQSNWPILFIVMASAIEDRYAGSHEARLASRKKIPISKFKQQITQLLPGCDPVIRRIKSKVSTDPYVLLQNRSYKGDIYSGTSDRGADHDPRTRAAVPKESWRRKVPVDHPLMKLYDAIRTSRVTVVSDWQRYLEPVFRQESLI